MGSLFFSLGVFGSFAQAQDVWNSNSGDQKTALSAIYSTTTDWSTGLPSSTSAVQINSVLSGNGNQKVTLDTFNSLITLNSLSISEDVSGITNEFYEQAYDSESVAADPFITLTSASTSGALSINASNGGTSEVSLTATVA